jgi:Carbon-nitrogen hydrolase
MIEPYQVVGLISTMRGIRRREEISWNLEHISHMVRAASWFSSMDLPVRLICIPEGGLQGFTDEVLDLDHETYAEECAIDIPGPETDSLGRLAQQWNAYVIAQAKARHPEFPGRFFNVGFVIEPEDGTVILRHHKLVPLLPVEHSVTPHNVRHRWIELYGQLVYEQPIYPKNLYLERAPYTHGEYREQVIRKQVELLQERGVRARPGRPASARAPAPAPPLAPAKVDAQVPVEARAPAPTVG